MPSSRCTVHSPGVANSQEWSFGKKSQYLLVIENSKFFGKTKRRTPNDHQCHGLPLSEAATAESPLRFTRVLFRTLSVSRSNCPRTHLTRNRIRDPRTDTRDPRSKTQDPKQDTRDHVRPSDLTNALAEPFMERIVQVSLSHEGHHFLQVIVWLGEYFAGLRISVTPALIPKGHAEIPRRDCWGNLILHGFQAGIHGPN